MGKHTVKKVNRQVAKDRLDVHTHDIAFKKSHKNFAGLGIHVTDDVDFGVVGMGLGPMKGHGKGLGF